MYSPFIILQSSKTNRRKQKESINNTERDIRMTSNDLEMTSNDLKEASKASVNYKKIKLKGGNPNDNDNLTQGSFHIEQGFFI